MDTFMCGVCSLSFDYFFTLLKHKTEHLHGEQSMKCPFCCKTIFEGNDLTTHLKLAHGVVVGIEDNVPSDIQSITYKPDRFDQKKVEIILDKTAEDELAITNVTSLIEESSAQQKLTINDNGDVENSTLNSGASHQCQHKPNKINKLSQFKSTELKLSSSGSSYLLDADVSSQQTLTNALPVLHQNNSSLNQNIPSQTDLPALTDESNQMKCSSSDGFPSNLTVKEKQLSTLLCRPSRQESKHSEPSATSPLKAQLLMGCGSSPNLSTSGLVNAIPSTAQAKTDDPDIKNQSVLDSEELVLSNNKHSTSDDSKRTTVGIFQNGNNSKKCIVSNNSELSDKESIQPDPTDFYFLLGSVSIQGNSMTYERTEFRCLHCTFSTTWRPSLVKHMKGVHREILDVHCVLEMRNSKSSDECHSGSNLTKPRNNYKVLKMSEYLVSQRKTKKKPHSPRKLVYQDLPGHYPCLTCHKVFTRLRYLRRHHIVHRGERSHQCDLCGKLFKTRAALGSHRCTDFVDRQKTCFCCPQCSFTSNSRAAIHKHRQDHPCDAMLCHVCGAAYPDRSTLRRHIRVHDPSRPFACGHTGCTWRFKTDVMCRAHERGHNLSQNATKFHCTFCGYNFRQKHHLQRHVAKFHSTDEDDDDDGAGEKEDPFSTTLPLSSSSIMSASLSPHNLQKSFSLNQITTAQSHQYVPMDIAQESSKDFSQSNEGESSIFIYIDNSNSHQVSLTTPMQLLSSEEVSNNNLHRSDHSYFSSDNLQNYDILVDSHTSSVQQDMTFLRAVEENASGGVQTQSEVLEIIQCECDLVELLKSGFVRAQDQYGNLVQYKVADFGGVDCQDINLTSVGQQSPNDFEPVYFVDVSNLE